MCSSMDAVLFLYRSHYDMQVKEIEDKHIVFFTIPNVRELKYFLGITR